jgi:hypothetical protein
MSVTRLDLLLAYFRAAVKDRDEAVLQATTKFAKDPLHYLKWGDQSLVTYIYRHYLASYVLGAPEQTPSMVVRCLRELRRQELGQQLRYHGSSSTNPYANATEMAQAFSRSRELDGGLLDESWQKRIIDEAGLCPGCLEVLPEDVTSVPGHFVCACGHRTYFDGKKGVA